MNNSLSYPVLAMIILPLIVVGKILVDRLNEMREKKIHPQKLATRSESQSLLTNVNASDNLKNLFELPILFYVVMLLLIMAKNESTILLSFSWLYVISRYLHSFIHCTYNKVMHRFYAFLFSNIFLLVIIGFAFRSL